MSTPGTMPQHAPFTVERFRGEADLDAVVAVERRSFSNPWTREMLVRELEPPTCARVYVLRLPDAPVAAFCACWVIADELHINTIAVDLPYRGRGFGRALMAHVLDCVGQEGVRRATLEVRRSNEAAQRLYAGLGFGIAGVRKRYYCDPEEDALVLWRETAITREAAGHDSGRPPSP